jgi:ankyrin repeat protein
MSLWGRIFRRNANLFDPALAGDLARIKALLADKVDLNAKNCNGDTAFMFASQNGHLKVVQAPSSAGPMRTPLVTMASLP